MKRNEVEKLTGFSKQTILFYEREGLVSPKRDTNGYRNYQDEDIQKFLFIKFLRSMDISIEDIKLIFNDELSFQQCLEKQSHYLALSTQKYHDLKEKVDIYKERKIPLISGLEEIAQTDFTTLLGYQKTTPTICIGQKITKRYLIKKMISSLCFSFVLAGPFIVLAKEFGYSSSVGNIAILLTILIMQLIAFGLNLGTAGLYGSLAGLGIFHNNSMQYIEFDETGINYCCPRGFIERYHQSYCVLRNQSIDIHVNYDQIEKVKILKKKKYMALSIFQIPEEIETYDFFFQMQNGHEIKMINPILLDHDREIMMLILQEKVQNLQVVS